MNPYLHLVTEYNRLFREGKHLPHGGFPPAPAPPIPPDAPKALIFSPHPDDECIIGGLALRLLRESQWRIVNVAVTQGSNQARQAERWQELQNACRFLGFGLIQTAPGGLEKVNPKTRSTDPARWKALVDVIERVLRQERPRIVFVPHEHDWNSSHIGVHFLVMDALARIGDAIDMGVIETEYWGQMTSPNLMVESSVADVADLVSGVSFHAGEVRRNPFHLLLPAWMQDNVRRGSELVGGQGEAAPDFGFATLYRLRWWRGGSLGDVLGRGRHVGCGEHPGPMLDALASGSGQPAR